jgi:hypothetical protein
VKGSKALRRALGAAVVIAAAASLLGHDVVGSTYAFFNGETNNNNSGFAAGWIGVPTNISATYSSSTITTNWTPGTPLVNSQKLYVFDNNFTTTCPAAGSASYTTSPATFANNTTATYADTNRATSANSGNYFCYEWADTSTTYTSWTSYTVFRSQGGMYATAVALTNSNASIVNGDTIVISWDQQPTAITTPTRVCAYANGIVNIGDQSTTCSNSGQTGTIGKLTGATGIATLRNFASSTVATAQTGGVWKTTITLAGGGTTTDTVTGGSTWTLTPSTGITSSAGGVTACNTSPACTPTTTTNF